MFLLAINYYTLMASVLEVKQLYKIHVLDRGKHLYKQIKTITFIIKHYLNYPSMLMSMSCLSIGSWALAKSGAAREEDSIM